jgi:hypothetical protein
LDIHGVCPIPGVPAMPARVCNNARNSVPCTSSSRHASGTASAAAGLLG